MNTNRRHFSLAIAALGLAAALGSSVPLLNVCESLNKSYFGKPVMLLDILVGRVVVNPAAAGLLTTTRKSAKEM